jgi:hypothetical protein
LGYSVCFQSKTHSSTTAANTAAAPPPPGREETGRVATHDKVIFHVVNVVDVNETVMTEATTTTARDLILVLVIFVSNGLVIRVVPVLLDGRQTQGSFVDDSFQFPLSLVEKVVFDDDVEHRLAPLEQPLLFILVQLASLSDVKKK